METMQMYGGAVTLSFNPGRHMYTVDGKKVDGVTSVLGVINKPALLGWAARCAADHVRARLMPGMALDELGIKQLCDEAVKAHLAKRDRAADIGTLTHQWIEKYIKGENPDLPLNEEVRNGAKAFMEWVQSRHVEFIHSERRIFSRKYSYAGTLDFEARIDGELFVGDIKTSSAIYPEMFFQTAAYQHARQEEEGHVYHGNIIVNCKKDGGLDVKESREFDENFRAFLGALTLYRRIEEVKYA